METVFIQVFWPECSGALPLRLVTLGSSFNWLPFQIVTHSCPLEPLSAHICWQLSAT